MPGAASHLRPRSCDTLMSRLNRRGVRHDTLDHALRRGLKRGEGRREEGKKGKIDRGERGDGRKER